MNDLVECFENHQGRVMEKWSHYLESYQHHFARFRDREVHVLEIGVNKGGSLQMWKRYFGPLAQIHGVDIKEKCKQYEEDRIRIWVGDQGDRGFLRELRSALPRIDVVIDDGGHTMTQQIATFEELFPAVSPNGVYVCEDTHTSYWHEFGGGYRSRGSFIEYAKDFIDRLHAWHSRDLESFRVDDFTRSTHSVHFYPSMVVIEKRPTEPPSERRTGDREFGKTSREGLRGRLAAWRSRHKTE